ncbi:uncharacterized protein FYW49_013697 [Xenentodon cancila]
MDVQTENTDPPPNESQPSGKIRKGFKLFGKRKPGNIFSIRNKGDGNKSPVIRSKTFEGLSETDSQADKEKGQELSRGQKEPVEDETLEEDGVLAAATARNSISSACSAKSLTFFSLLRGGRRGVGDRRVHTVSQPVARQRRGLMGLFGNGKFRMKDKEDKEEAPPSPLLMSSRANSVEIIKEDLTLTPKCQPRTLDSPEMDTRKPVQSPSAEDSAARSPPETLPVTTGNVRKRTEDVSPSPTSELPLVPGDNSLSSLLADISSLLTFDSISGGGDIMADVEAEWGKASSAISAAGTRVSPSSSSHFSKSSISSLRMSTTVSTAATAKPVLSSTVTKPSTAITTFTTSSTLTSHSVKLSSDSTSTCDPSTSITLKSTACPTTTKPSTTPTTLTSLSPPAKSSPASSSSKTVQFTLSTFATTTAPSICSATVVKAPSVSSSLTSSASKPVSEIASPPLNIAAVSKPLPAVTSSRASANIPPATHSSPIPVAQLSTVKLNSGSILNQSASYKPTQSSTLGESKTPATVSTTPTITAKPSSPALVIPSKTTTVSTSSTASGSVFTTLSKPSITSTPPDLNKIPSTHVTFSDFGPSSNLTTTTKSQPSIAPLSSASLDKASPMTTPITAPISLDKMSPTPTPVPAATTHSATRVSPTPAALGRITLCQSVASSASAQIPVSSSKEVASLAQKEASPSKCIPTPAEVPVSTTKDAPAPVKIQAVPSKESSKPAHVAVSISKDPPAVSLSKAIAAPGQIPVSLSLDSPAPVCIQVSVSKAPFVGVQIPISQIKTHPSPAISPPSPPAPLAREAPDSAKMRGPEQASVDHQLARPGGTGGQGSQAVPIQAKEVHNEPQISLQEPSKEKKPPQGKASGLSKIPVVGGGRGGKIPVRESQHVSEEPRLEPTTPVLEEKPHFNSHVAESRDKISTIEANMATEKHSQEERQQPQQSKVPTSSARDSKIPVKHAAQSHAVSQTSQTKEPPRTKIPVSKVPVRKVGNKSAATGAAMQVRK